MASSGGNLQIAVDTAVKYGLSHIEFGVIHGQYFVHGLGYDPSVSLQSNPRALRRYLDEKGLKVSQIDAAFPMMGPAGSTFGVQYVQQAIRFAAEIGCPMVDTTDGAQKTDGYQRNDNLLLSDKARADSIPGLEIEADDVRCTHGSTSGRVDEELIFYARSRGFTRIEAIKLIVTGFFQQVFDRVTIESVRNALALAISRRVRDYE